ncbi:phage tail tube protein [Nocardiopsis trehalosi]|uniref:phage tail tube protein n=1 Tax=Nocardiopsis trehalosi TaxID=109329 RepID=UPI00082CD285|nr:hypothetical protein [Nocardiopsis trehalosi]
MAATDIAPVTRYFNPAITRVLYVLTIASKAAPTRVELDAGTDLSNEIAELSGFQVTSGQIPTPDLGRRFTSSIPGRTSADDSSITFYADEAGEDVRSLLPRDTEGFIVIMDGGDVTGQPMDVYPIRVASVGKMRSVGDEAARLQIQFSITSEPAEDVAIPTAA